MARFLRNVVVTLSLLAFLCCAVMSVRARSGPETVWLDLGASATPRLKNVDSAVLFEWDRDSYVSSMPQNSDEAFREANSLIRLPGVRWFDRASDGGGGFRVYLAHWLISSLTAPLPLIALYHWSGRVKRTAGGMCPGCGYDLRESRDRCPECGREIAPGELAR
jgi:hypothetical protein